MALKPCKSCKQQVDTTAKTCPHCGVANPGVTAGQQFIGLIILAVIVVFAFSMCSSDSDEPAAEAKPKVDDATCMKDLQCWGDRQSIAGGIRCRQYVEKLAKYSFKWTDGTFETKFSHFRWLNQQQGTLTLLGDKIEFQNGFGAFQPHVYECDYNPATEQILDVRAYPGRL